MRIIEYKMVNNYRDGIINEKVNALIKLGWQPLGGISNHNGNFCQAMVKYATQKDDAFEPDESVDHLPFDGVRDW